MSLRWVLLVLLVAYGVNAFAEVENFNQLVSEAVRDQNRLAAEIQTQLGISNEKTRELISESNSVTNEGFKIRIIR